MKILVAIANYGPYRFGYLDKIIQSYQQMPFEVDLVIHSDRPKRVPDGVRLIIGLPTEDPYSLPFAHKQFFAEQKDDYDLFIYSEDDILIVEQNVKAFVEVTEVLPQDEIAGLFRFEIDASAVFFVDAHGPFDWVPGSVRQIGKYAFATFSNAHSGCYLLTRAQLQRVIDSGGYLVAPHCSQRYATRASAATDPYTQCGLTKRLCLSHFDSFLVHHLPNTYIGVLGAEEKAFRESIQGLLASAFASSASAPVSE